MNQTEWECAQRKDKKHAKTATIVVVSLLIIASVIVLNNEDLFSGRSNSSKNSNPVDSVSFTFSTDESSYVENLSGQESETTEVRDTVSKPIPKPKAISVQSATVQPETTKSSLQKIPSTNNGQDQKSVKKTDKSAPEKVALVEKTGTQTDLKTGPDTGKLSNKPAIEQYILLADIKTTVIDRKDIIIYLALELFYSDSIAEQEILIKRDALKVIALKVIQRKELAAIRKDAIARELENEMNVLFERKTLSKVRIREFQIEKVVKR